MKPRIGVITFPGTLRRPRCPARGGPAGRRGGRALARRLRSRRLHGRDRPGRLLVRRLPARRRDRPLRADHARGRGLRRGRRPRARHLQRLPGAVRGRPAARRPAPQPPRPLRLPRRRPPSSSAPARRGSPGLEPGAVLRIPVKHHDGAWYAPPEEQERVEAGGQVALRYADNPNGALADVACVTNAAGNVCGLMPHPEHAVDEALGPLGGRPLLEGLLALARAHRRATLVSA